MLGNIRASSIGVVCMGFSHGYGKVPSEEYFECRDLYQIIRRHLEAFEKVKAGRQDGMEKAVTIRRVKMGDENILAYIQTESWKEAFRDIVPEEKLLECTQIERVTRMYRKLLEEQKGNGYILELDGKPHCIAWWDKSREKSMPEYAELICIHSLKGNWHKGYGSRMMERILEDVKEAGYSRIMLWVFEKNIRAIRFYEAHGFAAGGKKQAALEAVEEMYIKEI